MPRPVIHNLKCSSMSHVIDRATAFLFCSPPYTVIAVEPNGVTLERPASLGITATRIEVTAEIPAWWKSTATP